MKSGCAVTAPEVGNEIRPSTGAAACAAACGDKDAEAVTNQHHRGKQRKNARLRNTVTESTSRDRGPAKAGHHERDCHEEPRTKRRATRRTPRGPTDTSSFS